MRRAGELAKSGSPDGIEELAALLRCNEGMVRREAIRALGRIAHPSVVDVLIPALADPQWSVRARAAVSLGAMGDNRALAPLSSLAASDVTTDRVAAMRAIGEIGDESALPLLEHGLRDPKREVTHAALWGLSRLGTPESKSVLEKRHQTARFVERWRTSIALGYHDHLRGTERSSRGTK
jgi:HEAT repeat protein